MSVRALDGSNTNLANPNATRNTSLTLVEQSDVSVPIAGEVSLFASSTTQRLKRRRSDMTEDVICEANDLAAYLPISGVTSMTANLNMGTHNITNVTQIVPTGGIEIGSSSSASLSTEVSIGQNSSATVGDSTAVGYGATASNNSVAIGANAGAASSGGGNIAIGVGSAASNASISNSIALGFDAAVLATESIAIGDSASNSTAHSCIIRDSAIVNIRPNSATCDLGTVASPFQDLHASRNIVGSSLTSSVNALVTGPGSAVSSNLPSFNASPNVLQDSGILSTSVCYNTGSTVTSNNFPSFNSTGGRSLQDSGSSASSFVATSGSSMSASLTPNTTSTIDLGSSSNCWKSIWCKDQGIASSCVYSANQGAALTNSTAATSLTSGMTNAVGAMTLSNAQGVATSFKITFYGVISATGTDNCQISFMVNGSSKSTITLTNSSYSNTPFMGLMNGSITNDGHIYLFYAIFVNGATMTSGLPKPSYTRTQSNTFDIQGQWNNASSSDSITLQSVDMVVQRGI